MVDRRDATTHTHVHASGPTGDDDAPARAGDPGRLGRYRIGALLGTGGMGSVYAGHDPELDRAVAIKVLHRRADATDPETLRLRREARSLARLRHRHVVAVYESGVDDERMWMAMELVAGETLARWAQAHPPGEGARMRTAMGLLRQAGEGLAAAHEVGLVHRDFKPSNVLVGLDGRVRVVDFGLARPARGRDEIEVGITSADDVGCSSGITAVGLVAGTPRYMSPEQHAGAELDGRSDQFSFCVAAWEVLHGAAPFRGTTAAALAAGILDGPEPPPPGTGVPGWITRVLRKGLAPRASQRFDSMRGLLDALDPARRRANLVLAGAVGLAGMGVLAALGASQPAAVRVVEDPCADARLQAEIEAVWNAERRDRVRAGVLASGEPYAADVLPRVEDGLDAYSNAWVSTRRQTCVAPLVPRDERTLDGRTACLQDALTTLDTTLTAVASGRIDAARVDVVLDALGWPDACALADDDAVPNEEGTRALRARIADANAIWLAGDPQRGLELASAIADDASRPGDEILRADALQLVGTCAAVLGDDERATQAGELAYALVDARGDWRRAFRLAIDVARRHSHRPDRARPWLRAAEAALARTRLGQVARAQLLLVRSEIASALADPGTSEALAREALALVDEDRSPEVYLLTSAIRFHLAQLLRQQGRRHETAALGAESLRIESERHGPRHPRVGEELVGLGQALAQVGRLSEARDMLQRARDIFRAARGHQWRVAGASIALMGVLTEMAEPRAAEAAMMEAIRACETCTVDQRRRVDKAYVQFLFDQGRPRDAMTRLEQIDREDAGANEVDRAAVHETMGDLAYALADLPRAATELGESIRLYPDGSAMKAQANMKFGIVAMASADHDTALAAFQRAEALWRGIGNERMASRCLAMQAWQHAALGHVDTARGLIAAVEARGEVDGLIAVDVHWAHTAVELARGRKPQAQAAILEALGALPRERVKMIHVDHLIAHAAELGVPAEQITALTRQ